MFLPDRRGSKAYVGTKRCDGAWGKRRQVDREVEPGGCGVLGVQRQVRRTAQPCFLDLCGVSGLLRVAALQHRGGAVAAYRVRLHRPAALRARGDTAPRRGDDALPLYFRRGRFWRAQLDWHQRAVAPYTDRDARDHHPEPRDPVLALRRRGGSGRLRRRKLLLQHGEHRLLLPQREKGHGARDQRGGRKPRRWSSAAYRSVCRGSDCVGRALRRRVADEDGCRNGRDEPGLLAERGFLLGAPDPSGRPRRVPVHEQPERLPGLTEGAGPGGETQARVGDELPIHRDFRSVYRLLRELPRPHRQPVSRACGDLDGRMLGPIAGLWFVPSAAGSRTSTGAPGSPCGPLS